MPLLVVQQKIEDMIGYGLVVLRQFPKTERYVLGADIRAVVCAWQGHAQHANAHHATQMLRQVWTRALAGAQQEAPCR